MPEPMHYLKAVRRAVTAALTDAAIEIPVGSAPRAVTILTNPPAPGYAPLVGPVFGVLSPITDLDLALLRPTDATLVPLIRR